MAKANPTLPFRRDAWSRFLPWITAFMVYLALLALAGVLALDGAARRWEAGGGVERLTVQYVAPEAMGADERAAAFDALLALLRDTPGVRSAEPLTREALVRLLEPWLGASAPYDALPLPALIDIAVDPSSPPDRAALERALADGFPGAALDDPAQWLDRLAALARSVQGVAAAIVLFVLLVAVGTVVVSTRMGLAAHREVIEVVHLIGAEDAYLARQFQRQAFLLALEGAGLGLALAAATGFVLAQTAGGLSSALLPRLAIEPWGWGALGGLPLLIALIAMATARVTVLRSLARMP